MLIDNNQRFDMKKVFILLLALACTVAAHAQVNFSRLTQKYEITEIEAENSDTLYELFYMENEGERQYFISLHPLSVGGRILKVSAGPIYTLFIPIGSTFEESLATLKNLQALIKSEPRTSQTIQGCVAFGLPNEDLETVTVTCRKLITRSLEFGIEREGGMLAAYIGRPELASLVSGLKFEQKLRSKK